MRKLFVFMHVSLDGYVEGEDHDISWFSGDDQHFETYSDEQSREVDTILFGRKTYDLMKSFWPTPEAAQAEPDIARFMNETAKVVVSHAPFEPGWSSVNVITGDVLDSVRELKTQPGKAIAIFGSNDLCVSLLEAGLIDELRVVINPVVLGEGTSFLRGLGKKKNLRLIGSQTFKSGKTLLRYEPLA